MTIRSKTRKAEIAARRAAEQGRGIPAPPASSPGSTLRRDDLPAEDSLAIELRALREGWLNGDPKFAGVRLGLIQKVATMAAKSEDPRLAIMALRAIAQTEHRERSIQLQAIALSMRPKPTSELPQQINIGLNVSPAGVAPVTVEAAPKPHELIAQLISRADVRAAATSRPLNAPLAS